MQRLAPARLQPEKPVGVTDSRVISDANRDNDWELGESYAKTSPAVKYRGLFGGRPGARTGAERRP